MELKVKTRVILYNEIYETHLKTYVPINFFTI